LQKRETSPPEKEEPKSPPTTTTPAPTDQKERKTRETAGKSGDVKGQHRIETNHKKSNRPERPKRQLNDGNQPLNQNSQLGQPGQLGVQQGQLGQVGQQQYEARREQNLNNYEHRRPSRSTDDGLLAEHAKIDANAEKDAKSKATSNSKKQ